MQFTIPLYVETRKDSEGGPTRHHVRPLFFSGPARSDEDLSRAQQRLVGDLQQLLIQLGREQRHDLLSAWGFCPEIEQHRIDLLLDLRRRTARGRYFFFVFRALDRKLAICPALPQLWFEITRHQTLACRATETLTEYFRKLERDADEVADVRPEEAALQGTAWVTTVELEVDIVQSFKDPRQQLLALLGSKEVADGAAELRNCGRCLNWQYPAELAQAHLRDHEVAELERRLISPDRRPVLLLGRRLVGKTAIVHEYVSRVTARRQSVYAARRNVWWLSPQRLVSGMSYVGQWESRLLAILKEAKKRDHVLYFDDLPGLLLAGRSRDSSLSMGQVIRPYLKRRDVRILGEITPESWRVLREQDRGLADLFEVLPVAETDREATARIVLAARRSLEQTFHCRFSMDSLPAVLEIERRYSTDAAFPGKAIQFLKDLALNGRRKDVTRDQVLNEFHRRSGLSSKFLDPRQQLPYREIADALSAEVVGQTEPVAAVADLLSIAKARLNDTGRPMGSLLFVGPTGVGKTQLAKATARFLFGNANRLVRFDLNEFVTRGSATRLVGTFDQPDGLLTGAIRRQPFAVVLLDEIEKAHPEVFDLLLQVLGEGRLSDGLGRTVSFSNTLIVMTSNLGVRENSKQLGFANDGPVADHLWQKAAEQFFRPEFFNRIDRIVPFQQLSRSVVEQVARLMLDEMLMRDGLARRRCVMTIEPQALDRAVDAGYSPTLGARSLKRSLERMLIQPAGRRLAALRPQTLTRLHLYPSPGGIAVDIQPLLEAEPPENCIAMSGRMPREQLLEAARRFVVRVDSEIADLRPAGPISVGQLSDRQRAYYLLQERCRKIRAVVNALTGASIAQTRPGAMAQLPGGAFRHARKMVSNRRDTPHSFFLNLAREESDMVTFHQSLRDLFEQAETLDAESGQLAVLHESALIQQELTALREQHPTRMGLCVRSLDGQSAGAIADFAAKLHDVLSDDAKPSNVDLGVDCVLVGGNSKQTDTNEVLFELNGVAASVFARCEAGVHLDYCSENHVRVIQVIAIPLGEGQSVVDAWNNLAAARALWIDELSQGNVAIESDPLRLGSVVRLYESWGVTLDFRTGDMTEGMPDTSRVASVSAWSVHASRRVPITIRIQELNHGLIPFSDSAIERPIRSVDGDCRGRGPQRGCRRRLRQ